MFLEIEANSWRQDVRVEGFIPRFLIGFQLHPRSGLNKQVERKGDRPPAIQDTDDNCRVRDRRLHEKIEVSGEIERWVVVALGGAAAHKEARPLIDEGLHQLKV